MKNLIYILTFLSIFGCNNSETKNDSSTSDRLELIPEPDRDLREEYEQSIIKESKPAFDTNICSSEAIDFLKLKEKDLRTQFFFSLDSIRKVQYPNDDQENSIMVDLTPEYLNKLLADINYDSLKQNSRFVKEYHFNIAPENFTDPKICKDKIEITFDKTTCKFRLRIYNTFLAEPNWCTESSVIYVFGIKNNRIVDFWRNEAG